MQALQLQPISPYPPPPLLPPPPSPASLPCSSACLYKPISSFFFCRKELSDRAHPPILDKPVDSSTYASLIKSCTCPDLGKQVHAHALKSGCRGHEFIETKLLQMYVEFGCLMDAAMLFDKMPLRNLYSWSAMLRVLLAHDMFEEAFLLFQELLVEGIRLKFFVFPVVLNICGGISALELGRQLHGMVVKFGYVANVYVGNALIDMYGKCEDLDAVNKVLTKMPSRDCVSWNSVVTAYAANGMVNEAVQCFDRMSALDSLEPNLVTWSAVVGGLSQNGYDEDAIALLHKMQAAGIKPNERTLASILPACARLQRLSLGKEIHCYVLRHGYMTNSFVVNGLVDVYRKCNDMLSAQRIFSKFSVKNAASINTMIVGYCDIGEIPMAKKMFDQMELMGAKRDIISWNSMISGYVDNCLFHEALNMFLDFLMEQDAIANSFTLGSLLSACTELPSLRLGKAIHSQAIVRGLHSDPFVSGALVDMYCICGDLGAAHMAFNKVTEHNTAMWNVLLSSYVRGNHIEDIENLLKEMRRDGFSPNIYTWNGIITGLVENGQHVLALQLFSDMQASNMRPDIYTIGIILSACTRLLVVEQGLQVHAQSIRCGYDRDVHIGAALVDMYAKCGRVEDANHAYYRISNPNLVSHNAMLTAYAMHGPGNQGITLFQKMLRDSIIPDQVTFLSVLSSCMHAGSVRSGCEFFSLMLQYNLKPTIKHYTCVIDLLSRAGQLDEAYELIKEMPMEPDSVVWSALLGGCVIHGDVELGEIAAERLLKLEPDSSGNYVLLANLYASARRWSDLARTRQVIRDRGMHKSPGCSWIEDKSMVHVFLSNDESHGRTDEIYATLNNLSIHMKKVVQDTV